MKKDYTILVPTMLPMHFKMFINILHSYDYKAELLETSGKHITECGLKYVHNDTCYPAILVIGQLINALQSGKYNPEKTAVLLMQTGGGCRASNYISLLRKALSKAGYGHVPVISFNLVGIDKHPGFKLSLPMLYKMLYAVLYGDLLMSLRNQCKPYELNSGESDETAEKWTKLLTEDMSGVDALRYKKIKQKYAAIVRDFASIPLSDRKKVRVGIVGEIFVKFSPLGNNNLEEFLISEGTEVVMPGLLEFCFYSIYDNIMDNDLYGINKIKAYVSKFLYKFLLKKQRDIIETIKSASDFTPPTSFDKVLRLVDGYIGLGVKMGEGWLLTAEMLELVEQGVKNIICAQPFGCLPNHIVGKGMMKPIKEKHPDVNIVAIDYDPGATQINQENRIKLMLANAAEVS
ncbi:MAG: 2-hydroxyglutaryl-CoA dehydratase [Firmicutes bacterium HGW-Firmicutes-21]|nr:MAG: 2-hydroxyglutaryl-CoA dehydratase [Firmicutes bacterium HGW-Firmicutes-21]